MNVSYVYQSAQVGEFRPALLYATGPASYSQATGDPVSNPGANEYITFPNDCTTKSGNYSVKFRPLATGIGPGDIRAGAPSPSQSGWVAIWEYSGSQGVTSITATGGTGMTPGIYPLVLSATSGGAGAAATLTVLTATTYTIQVSSGGQGYAQAPTVNAPATGGTPPAFTVIVAPSGGLAPNTANLSAESIQFGALVSQL